MTGKHVFLSWKEIKYFHTIWNQLNLEFKHLGKLLPVTRKKRALLNLGGEILNFLFGTATSTDLPKLHQVIRRKKLKQDIMTHSVEYQLTYTELDDNVRQNARDVSLLARTLKTLVFDVMNLNDTVKQLEVNLVKRVELLSNVRQRVRELEFFSLQLEQYLLKIRQGLDVTSTGKLSAALLPPHNLSQILQQVALMLPSDATLIAGTDLEDMFIYYDIARVHAYATSSEIRLVIRFPLRGTDCVMNLYKTKTLPVYEPVLRRHIQIVPEVMYMAVTESRQHYSLLTLADLHKCQQGLFTICESDFPLCHKGTRSCSGALSFGKNKMAHEYCNKINLKRDFKQVWIHHKGAPNFWIYRLPTSIKITKTCRYNGTSNSVDLEIKETGILYEEENCQIFSSNFPTIVNGEWLLKLYTHARQVVIPELPELLTPEETQVLISHQDQADGTLGALDALMTRSLATKQQKEVSLRELLNTLEHDTHETSYYKWIIAAIASTIILLISYITSKYWQRRLLKIASRISWR
jgi:hypothetical protein